MMMVFTRRETGGRQSAGILEGGAKKARRGAKGGMVCSVGGENIQDLDFRYLLDFAYH